METGQYITIKQFKEKGGVLKQDRLLYMNHPTWGFDSCDQVQYNNIDGREDLFFVMISDDDNLTKPKR